MKKIISKSDLITLRLTQKVDLDFVIKAENEIENAQYIGNWSKEQHLNSLLNEDILHLIVEDNKNNNSIGYIIRLGLKVQITILNLKDLLFAKKGKDLEKKH